MYEHVVYPAHFRPMYMYDRDGQWIPDGKKRKKRERKDVQLYV